MIIYQYVFCALHIWKLEEEPLRPCRWCQASRYHPLQWFIIIFPIKEKLVQFIIYIYIYVCVCAYIYIVIYI